MKHRVSFIVNPNAPIADISGDVTLWSAMTRMKESMANIGCPIPSVRYRVTYTLAPKHGRLKMTMGSLNPQVKFVEPYERPKDTLRWDAAIVCQLPEEWAGLRFNRKVRLLAREEVADAGLPTTKV